MADLPEYHKSRAIQPAPVVGGFTEVYNKLGNSSSIVGQVGKAVAQSAANELAARQGQKAAKENPEMNLFPAFTESDSYFVKAFEHEAYNSTIFSIRDLAQKEYETISKQPLSSESLNLYEKNVMTGIKNMLQNVPERMRPDLEREALTTYNYSFYKLSDDVHKQGLKDLKFVLNRNLDQNLRFIIDLGARGDVKQIKDIVNKSISYIDESERIGRITAKQAHNWRDSFYLAYEASKNQIKVTDIFQRDGEEAAKKEASDVDSKLNASKSPNGKGKDVVSSAMTNTILQSSSNKLKDQDIKYLELQEKSDSNTLAPSDIIDYADPVSGVGSANWHKYNKLRKVGDNRTKELLMSEIGIANAIRNKQFTEDKFTPGQIKNYAQSLCDSFTLTYGREPTLMEEAAIHHKINDKRSGHANKINDIMNSGSPKMVMEANAVLRKYSSVSNAKFLAKINPKARLTGRLFENMMASNENLPPEQALDVARKQTGVLSDDETKIRLQQYKQANRDSGLNEITNAAVETTELMNSLRGFGFLNSKFEEKDMPAPLIQDYMETKKRLFLEGKDEELAKEIANVELKKYWGISKFNNGKTQVFGMPVEKAIEGSNLTTNDVKNKFIIKLMTTFHAQQKTNAPYKFEFAEGQLADKALLKQLITNHKKIYKKEQINVNKFYINTDNKKTIEEGYIEIGYDQLTKSSHTQGNVSYPVYWISKKTGDKEQIYMPNNNQAFLRFNPLDKK